MTPIRKRLLLAGTAMAGMTIGMGVLTTQYVAWRLGFHPSLGPSLGGVYPPWAILDWAKQPWPMAAPILGQAKALAILFGAGIAGMVMMASMRNSRRPKPHPGVHGTASFEAEEGLREASLLAPKPGEAHAGLYLGVWKNAKGDMEYIRHSGPEHLMSVGPLRSGKSAGVAVLNLLSWPESVYVNDPKGELWDRTAGWRKAHAKNKVIRWEPGAETGSARYNFLDEVRLGTPNEYGDVATIVEAVADPTGAGLDGKDHWLPTAADLLNAVTLYNLHKRKALGRRAACLADTLRTLQDPDQPADRLFAEMLDNDLGPGGRRHDLIARAARAMLDRADKERSGVVSTAVRMMRLFADPVVARNTSSSDFTISDLMDHDDPVSLYVVVPESRRQQMRPLTRLFDAVAMGRLMDSLSHKHKLLWLGEEFLSKGKQEDFVDRLSRCAGAGIRAFLLVQDYPQLLDTYGNNEQVTGKCHIRIFHTPNDHKTAGLMSDLAGRTTIITEDVSESGDRMGASKGYGRSFHTVSRPLLTPDEAGRMKTAEKTPDGTVTAPGEVLIFVAGRQPIRAVQSFWFLDDAFTRRGSIPAPASDSLRIGSSRTLVTVP